MPEPAVEATKAYLDRLLKLIPAEVLSLYLTGRDFIAKDGLVLLSVWAMLCLAGVVVVKALGTSDKVRSIPPDWRHIALSSIAFVIWVYSTGGPFELIGWYQANVGSLMILAFTFFAPYVYRGEPS